MRNSCFIKEHEDSAFTDPIRARHSRAYLVKEHVVYDRLKTAGFAALPSGTALHEDSLLTMEALHPRDGWRWKRPDDLELQHRYIAETLDTLRELERHDASELPSFLPDINDSFPTIQREGWHNYSASRPKIIALLSECQISGATQLREKVDELYTNYRQLPAAVPSVFSHHDIRQSNIAWHPEKGVKIIDWSWAGQGVPGTDTTSLLIDIAKSGVDVLDYLHEYFNPDHALVLIGFWLEHSTWPTASGDQTVRLHQVASAIAGASLLGEYTKLHART